MVATLSINGIELGTVESVAVSGVPDRYILGSRRDAPAGPVPLYRAANRLTHPYPGAQSDTWRPCLSCETRDERRQPNGLCRVCHAASLAGFQMIASRSLFRGPVANAG